MSDKAAYRVETALTCPTRGGDWREVYEVHTARRDKLVCTCETQGEARRVCRALNLGHAYGRGNKSGVQRNQKNCRKSR